MSKMSAIRLESMIKALQEKMKHEGEFAKIHCSTIEQQLQLIIEDIKNESSGDS